MAVGIKVENLAQLFPVVQDEFSFRCGCSSGQARVSDVCAIDAHGLDWILLLCPGCLASLNKWRGIKPEVAISCPPDRIGSECWFRLGDVRSGEMSKWEKGWLRAWSTNGVSYNSFSPVGIVECHQTQMCVLACVTEICFADNSPEVVS